MFNFKDATRRYVESHNRLGGRNDDVLSLRRRLCVDRAELRICHGFSGSGRHFLVIATAAAIAVISIRRRQAQRAQTRSTAVGEKWWHGPAVVAAGLQLGRSSVHARLSPFSSW
jgi:hypothetical protein